MRRRCAVALLILASIGASGCGYSLAGRGSFLPAYIKVVGITPIENRTAFQRVEQVVTNKLRDEFINRNKYSVIPTAAGADAVLSGAITNIIVQPASLNEQQLASRYLFTVTMRVQFLDTRTNEVLWANEALTFREEVDLRTRSNQPVEGAVFLEQESAAVDRIAEDLARTVVSSILEAF
jgi:outer membrane lipopolysaccharide assembly protein LptE/RlpB